MQRIANLLFIKNDQVLLLKKPRRGWYVAPGGKLERGESPFEAAVREFREETGLRAVNPLLKGAYTIAVEDGGQPQGEWMLFTFVALEAEGDMLADTREGQLEWHPLAALRTLPMAEGDRSNLLFAAQESGVQCGTYRYTPSYDLLGEALQRC